LVIKGYNKTLLPYLYNNFVVNVTATTKVEGTVEEDDQFQLPSISSISPNQTLSPGQTLQLTCILENANHFPNVWLKLDDEEAKTGQFISTGSSLIIRDNRMSVTLDRNSNNSTSVSTLQIEKINKDDTGTYQCEIFIGVQQKVVQSVHVNVLPNSGA